MPPFICLYKSRMKAVLGALASLVSGRPENTTAPWSELGGAELNSGNCRQYTKIDFAEPPVRIFSTVGCRDNMLELRPTSDEQVFENFGALPRAGGGGQFGGNAADSMVVPPNMWVEVLGWDTWKDQSKEGHFATFGPGIVADISTPYRGINRDDADSILIHRTKPWGEFLQGCCLGQEDATACQEFANPYGGKCQQLLEPYCRNPANFFSPKCKQWIGNLQSQTRNQIASDVCNALVYCPEAANRYLKDYPDIDKEYNTGVPLNVVQERAWAHYVNWGKGEGRTWHKELCGGKGTEYPTLTPEQQAWCACYHTREIPKELQDNPVVRAFWPCMDTTCNDSTKALQPFEKNCPSTLAICQQRDIKNFIETSEVGNATIANTCGNITVAPPPGPSGPSGSGSTPTGPSGELVLSKNQKIAIGATLATILLALGILIFIVARKK